MTTDELEHLIKMANQIAVNVYSGTDDNLRAEKTAAHIQRFWAPSMRDKLGEYVRNGGEGLNFAVCKALAEDVQVPMNIQSIDHLVLVVNDLEKTIDFYKKILGMKAVKNSSGKWSLQFGRNKISLQSQENVPEIAKQTTPGSGNFCLITETRIEKVVENLNQHGVKIIEGPIEKEGAIGPIMSVYFYDLDGNLVEVSNQLATGD